MNLYRCLVLGGEGLAASAYVGCENLNTSVDPSPLAFPKALSFVSAYACSAVSKIRAQSC